MPQKSSPTSKRSFRERVLAVVARIPKGRILTYKAVAEKAGSPRAFRAVGNIMNKNRNPRVPCHRVIRSDGDTGGYAFGRNKKTIRLREEGAIS
jgi:O-6-methylguanine DNA methyltransferase